MAGCCFAMINAGVPWASPVREAPDRVAAVIDPALAKTADRVMMAIYDAILPDKDHEDQLMDFDRFALYRNRYGITAIRYRREIPEGMRKGEFLEFGVSVVGMADTDFSEFGSDSFAFLFPFLGIKFAGYQYTSRKYMKFSLKEIIRRNIVPFVLEQNKHLPLKLTLSPVKDHFQVEERVRIRATVENVSQRALWVKDIDTDTMYFLHADIPWEVRKVNAPYRKDDRIKILLSPGEKIGAEFYGSGFFIPNAYEIYGSYGVTFQGVRPSSITKVRIVE